MNLIALTAALALAAPPGLPTSPTAVRDVLYARRFTLDTAYTFDWRRDRPAVTGGYLVVYDVDPACVYPRQTAEPVLFVDRSTAERLNVGYTAGRVVAIVPDEAPATSGDTPRPQDLALAWFGEPGLPLEVAAPDIERERARAERAGIGRLAPDKLAHARAAGGEPLRFADKRGLLGEAARLMKSYTPDETAQIEAYEVAASLK